MAEHVDADSSDDQSADEGLAKHRVAVALVIILLITLANLRGIKESGRIFAVPTYIYIVVLTVMVFLGLTAVLVVPCRIDAHVASMRSSRVR